MNLQQPFLMPWMNFAAAVTQSQAQMSPVGTLTTVPGQTHLHPQHQHHPHHQQQVQKLVTLSHHMNPTQAQSTLLSAAQFAQLSAASQYGQTVPQTFVYPNPGSHHAGSGILSPGTLINPYLSAANGGVNNPLGACNGAGIPKMMVQGSTKDGSILAACVAAAAAAQQAAQAAAHHHNQHHHQHHPHQNPHAAAAAAAGLNGFPSPSSPSPAVVAAANSLTTAAAAAKFSEKRKFIEEIALADVKKAKLETKALKAKRPGFTDDRYNETAYFVENGLRKVYPYYFTFTTFTKGRWVGEKILEVFGREFRAHPVEEYERCILDGTLTVNYDQVDVEYRLRHNDLLANIVHRHETPVLSKPIEVIHLSEDLVVLDKPCSLPVHPCGRYRHNTVVFILAKEYNLKNLRTIHRLDRLTSGLLMFGRNPKKARDMEQQIRNRQVLKEYVCRVEGEFPEGCTECNQPVEVVSYKIGVCKVSPQGKECRTEFERLSFNGSTSVVLCRPFTGRMHQIRVHLQYLGFPVINDPLYNHVVFGPTKGKGGIIGKSDDQLIQDLIAIHNAENWLGMDGDSELSMFNKDGKKDETPGNGVATPCDEILEVPATNGILDKDGAGSDDENGHWAFDPSNAIESLERNPQVPKNCTITRPPPITRPGREPVVIRQPLERESTETITEQDNELLAKHQEYRYHPEKMTWDPNCYECKVKYRDPKPKDLVMYLHAWRYKGPNWQFQTRLPDWAEENWSGPVL
ncbi:pseudouridylate synthase RPUSD2-like [Tigriopus californicus]|uniref:pseudouridylate synthase RPUSD2-like n=1 Tax=Tigriopus californicus TaxID=6832 RepID=UPI0027DA1AB2|nr:pseudouridylate synthase RPUSD2-like [Tigriopus californicus]